MFVPRRGTASIRRKEEREVYPTPDGSRNLETGSVNTGESAKLRPRGKIPMLLDYEEVVPALLDFGGVDPRSEMPNYETELLRLYTLQAEISKDPYLHAHSRNLAVIRRQVAIFERFQQVLVGAHTILDWGCRHA